MMLNAWTDRSPVETLGLLLGCAVLSCGLLFSTPWIAAPQAPLSMGFRRQEYWRRLPFLSPGDLPNQGSNLCLLHYRQILYCGVIREAQILITSDSHIEMIDFF